MPAQGNQKMVDNQTIAATFKLGSRLLELYGENKFKIRSYENAARHINDLNEPLVDKGMEELEAMEGIGSNIAKKIHQIRDSGTFDELERLLGKTPEGILELLQVKGIGPKKIAQAWEILGITSPQELMEACKAGRLSELKGFGKKTEQNILEVLAFYEKNKEKIILPFAREKFELIKAYLVKSESVGKVSAVGQLRRNCQTIESLDLQVEKTESQEAFSSLLEQCHLLTRSNSNGYDWIETDTGIPVKIYFSNNADWYRDLFFNTGSTDFTDQYKMLSEKNLDSEEAIFNQYAEPYIPPEMREAYWVTKTIPEKRLQELISTKSLKGCLHNHSQFSDGANTIKEMADACQSFGYSYFGIADHSKAAFYANGLDEERLAQQAEAIDQLNEQYEDFKIFKGIEADILNNGDLDFTNDVLKTLDYVVASIHTPLKMDREKATNRLIKAVENPFTTILGHMTGRLLLRREGYPVDHERVIEACAENNVVIEINANPRRLDIDWHWMDFALETGVMLSINPDAHNLEGIKDMEYGVAVARKACVPSERILNTFSLNAIEEFFTNRKVEAIESTNNTV